jgi:transcriptional regulator with XRE-family HTH domain
MKTKKSSAVRLGAFLRARRQELNLTQGQVARKMGLQSSQYVSNWERGVSLPPVFHAASIRKIIRIYGLTLHEYVDRILFEQKVRIYERMKEKLPN